MQRLQFLSPSSSVEELLEEDEEEEEGNRLPSIDENCHVGADKVENGAATGGSVGANDGNNNDVVHFKGWLNYAKLQLETSSKKGLKKNWNKGENEGGGLSRSMKLDGSAPLSIVRQGGKMLACLIFADRRLRHVSGAMARVLRQRQAIQTIAQPSFRETGF